MPVRLALEAGRAVACKFATDPDAVARLEREAHLLQRFRHPGVVELIALRREADQTVLVTAFAGQHTLATVAPLAVDAVANVTASLAAILADLHASGFVHGRIDPSHVIAGSHGSPVLCGFGAKDGSPTDDVAAVGALLVRLLGANPDMEPIPDRRWASHRAEYARGVLLNLADRAMADDPAARPSASELADAIRTAVPTKGATVRRMPALVAAGAGLACAVFGVATLWGQRGVEPDDEAMASRAAESCDDSGVDVDGDGCSDAIEVTGGVIEVGERRWAVGAPGDEVVVGDWDCDGTATPALLRPDTGEVFVFPAWRGPGGRVVVGALTTVSGATGIRAAPTGAGDCPSLVVDRTSGVPVEVTPG